MWLWIIASEVSLSIVELEYHILQFCCKFNSPNSKLIKAYLYFNTKIVAEVHLVMRGTFRQIVLSSKFICGRVVMFMSPQGSIGENYVSSMTLGLNSSILTLDSNHITSLPHTPFDVSEVI